MSIEAYWIVRMQACEVALQRELASEQITHPIEEYQPGSERLNKLYAAMEAAQRYDWPSEFTVNL